MPDLTQDDRFIHIDTPLGKDCFVVMSMQANERLSEPYGYLLNLASEKDSIAAKDIVGKQIGFSVKTSAEDKRYFNGYVSSFSAHRVVEAGDVSVRLYQAEVVPWFWLLKLNSNCRVFQEKTVPDIIEQVAKDAGFKDYKLSNKGKYAKQDYCVQYQESDFAFVSRLMEESGIYYYFLHDNKKHTMVIADNAAAYSAGSEIEFDHEANSGMGSRITDWNHQYLMHEGKYTVSDYNFETPATDLGADEKTNSDIKSQGDFEKFEFATAHLKSADGKALAVLRIEESEARNELVSGKSGFADLTPGAKFKLKSHPVAGENQDYVTVSVNHQASQPLFATGGGNDSEAYSNKFQSVPSKVVFRPERITPSPVMSGPQSAKVVGAKNQEILTDKYGRVKIQFPWDREGKYDDKSSCFVRVAQSWAGAKRGFQFTPRVGDEVLVEFMNGDPDRPIITGSVYNADNMPPWKLPDDAHISGVKTLSTDKAKAKNFSELHFDDKIGKEKIYFHAERDFVRIVENNDELKIGFDAKDKGDQTIDIYNDRSVTIDKGNDTLTIKTGDRLTNIDKGDDKVTIKTGSQVVAIKAGEQKTEAAKSITFKVGGSSIKMDPSGITIKAAKISVQAQLKAEVKGTLVDVAASGVATIKGGLVKIN